MTVLSDRVDALEATNTTLVNILGNLQGTLQGAVDAGQGPQGWSPALTVQSDGARRVLQVTDWTGGGAGATKPAVGDYIGSTGIVSTAAEAIDIRGDTGGSAYDEWLALGNSGTEQDFIDDVSAQAVSATSANVTAAQAAEDKSEQWAEEIEDTPVETGKYSALHHAAKAEGSATAAATSEANASTSEINAANSATAASTSETNAATSETNAAASETASATSETNAAASETAALGYRDDAQAIKDNMAPQLVQMATAFTNSQTRYVEQHAFS